MFHKNLYHFRKKDNLSQEEFAEKMEVSRQTISKWEQGLAYPEMDRLLKMCDMFGCDLDTLIRKDIASSLSVEQENNLVLKSEEQLKEDFTAYDKMCTKYSYAVATTVLLVLFGIAMMFVLYYLLGQDSGWGLGIFLFFALIAVVNMVFRGVSSYYFRKNTPMVKSYYTKEQKQKASKNLLILLCSGIAIAIVGLISVAVGVGGEGNTINISIFGIQIDGGLAQYENLLIAAFQLCLSIAGFLIVVGCLQNSKFDVDQYNLVSFEDRDNLKIEECVLEQFKKDISRITKNIKVLKHAKVAGYVSGGIWCIAAAVFLLISFLTDSWELSWLTFVGAGIVQVISSTIFGVLENKDSKKK